ncbi:LytTR family DNA-binding domain-containing protein [Reichenbachiella agarivorans]|uniref:LytTR family DNA-binding domain-containing protein n=1 Tax=Reichenbachiella agarivorans TaxID=2979464 RepID=A0ABY6D0A8_9BACT|nr:LytTR family DNA-binding domain-containing protein [Reichenbachiella agarivorans]UXP33930.1 LytTR family DNA-binding domain-containing protein [Reichenbachiella agarivorans]
MKAIIIDDTRLARQELKHLLRGVEDVEIVAEAAHAEEAIELIESHQPDLIFLDIQMPGKDGFELLESLDYLPEVIFITAYNEYAHKAFDYNALDYLQKPLKEDRLLNALHKVRERLLQKTSAKRDLLSENDQVFVKESENCWFVELKDISLFEISDTYTKIHFKDQSPLIPKTLNYMEKRLDPLIFFRANRQQIINMKWIQKVEPWFSGSIRIHLKDTTIVEVSRRQTLKFKELMSF